ncbi:MAG: prolyl oligopeptidase family serine peptidase [Planctomycetaceae bacterium]|nr:prolyl oligopeptidase family serine peptidase [Planctomycetaceae bacterium]MBT4726326.1 prolyl oligopeptidase family serine peptidase [Planctomycetaceae bacterium]MBT5125271.1 prolyl oligopeptidase family serine peptidase [Planctomycetaceae bacterium]MBT5885385.1 prolyl oligopeptidase family serine peptidase [Planctomycetaceae bacterium]
MITSYVPLTASMRLAAALIKANKDFDLIVIPGGGHGDEGRYGSRRRKDFFRKHLLGLESPDINAIP